VLEVLAFAGNGPQAAGGGVDDVFLVVDEPT
jgi:hypothetical protein